MKNYTVFLDTGVSIEPAFDIDVDTVEGYKKLKQYAKKKLLRMLEQDQFDITYEEFDEPELEL
jgi:hypothetical protein